MAQSAEEFWESRYAIEEPPEPQAIVARAVRDALEYFGPMEGKRVLDIGCGTGATSLLLAKTGAQVTALDYSRNAVDSLARYTEAKGITNITPVCGDALKIDRLGGFDFVFGSLILHHIEPFATFCAVLRNALEPGGRGFFLENNAASEMLIWFREHVVGKLWVPRCGDGIEFPLTPGEIAMLRGHFRVETRIPEMIFFQLVSTYLLRRRLKGFTRSIDDLLFRYNVGKKYSYRQYVLIEG